MRWSLLVVVEFVDVDDERYAVVGLDEALQAVVRACGAGLVGEDLGDVLRVRASLCRTGNAVHTGSIAKLRSETNIVYIICIDVRLSTICLVFNVFL